MPSPGAAAPPTPAVGTMTWRALRRRCPVCGTRPIFRGWFRMVERCSGCHLRFARMEGQWTGDIGINTIVSFGVLFVTLMAVTLGTWPDVNTGLLLGAALGVVLVVPVVFFPFSKTVWLTIDLAMRPLEAGEATPPGRAGGDPLP